MPPPGIDTPRRRRLDRGPGWAFHGLCALLAGGILWAATMPVMPVSAFLATFFGLVALVLVWVVRLLVVALRTRRLDRAFWVAPAGALLTLVVLGAGVPLQLRWAVSQAAFAEAVRTGRTMAQPGEVERVGAYSILSIDPVPGGTVFLLAASGFRDGGFAYLPDGPAAVLEADRFESPEFIPLGDGWYRWTSSW